MRNVTQLSREKEKIKFCKGFPTYLESDTLSHSTGMIVGCCSISPLPPPTICPPPTLDGLLPAESPSKLKVIKDLEVESTFAMTGKSRRRWLWCGEGVQWEWRCRRAVG